MFDQEGIKIMNGIFEVFQCESIYGFLESILYFFKMNFYCDFCPRSSVFEAHLQKSIVLKNEGLQWIALDKIFTRKIINNFFHNWIFYLKIDFEGYPILILKYNTKNRTLSRFYLTSKFS